jgi:hypothetical protein
MVFNKCHPSSSLGLNVATQWYKKQNYGCQPDPVSKFLAKTGTGTEVPQFLVLENWNWELGPGYQPVPVCTRFDNWFF